MNYVGDLWVNLVICGLIIAGGLGFVVWIDLRLSLFIIVNISNILN